MKKKLEQILKKLDHIEYGFLDQKNNIYPDNEKDWDSTFSKKYRLQSPEECIKNKYGVCWDQVEVERYYLEQEQIDSSSYFIIAYDKKIEPTHTWIVVNDDNFFYWMEHSWETYRGVHKYQSLEKLLIDVKEKFEESIKKQNIKNDTIEIYKYQKPKAHLSCIEFMNYCENGDKIK